MIIVDVTRDTVTLRLGGSESVQAVPLILFHNHLAALDGATPGISPEVQAEAMRVAGLLAGALELHAQLPEGGGS